MPVHPNSVAVGDLNNDGNPDIIVPSWSPNQISVLLGDGSGAITAQSIFSTLGGPRFAIVADLNGDGNQDVATANQSANSVSLHFGNGTGALAASVRINVGLQPWHLAAADLNNDGALDLVTANSGSGTVSVLLNSGGGIFPAVTSFTVGAVPNSVAVADFNGDGHLDLVSADSGSNTVSLLPGDGTGAFGPAVSFPVESTPYTLVTGDFNSDGRPDLAVPNFGSATISVLLSQGGGFAAAVSYPVGKSPRAVVATDFDGDGDLDLATANKDGNSVSFLSGDGLGGFTPVREVGVGWGPFSLASVDFNSDGVLDVIVADRDGHTMSILEGVDGFEFSGPEATPVGRSPRGMAAADLNSDGHSDLVVANNGSSNISVLLGSGGGRWGETATYPVAQGPSIPVIADLNADGILDIAVSNASNNSVSVLHGTGDGHFAPHKKWPVASGPRSLAISDVNSDGRLDLITANYNAASASVLLATSSGGYAAAVGYAAVPGASGLVVGDFNEDGAADLAVISATTHAVGILPGTGTGSFNPVTTYPCGNAPSAIAVIDYDADGHLDLAITNETANTVTVLRGNGDGSFAAALSFPSGTRPLDIAVAELTGDTLPDLVVANAASNTVTIHEATGNGSFLPAAALSAGQFSRSLAIADFNLDGRPDVAVGNGNGDNVWSILSKNAGSITYADLALSIDNGATAIAAGGETTYSISLTNHGPASLDAITLNIEGSPQFTALEATPSTGSYEPASGIWSGLSLNHGDTIVLSLRATVAATANGSASIAGVVSVGAGQIDPNPANNSAIDTDEIAGEPPVPNAPPIAESSSTTVAEESSVAVVLSATDADGDPISFAIQQPPAHGTLSGVAPNLNYTPAANYFGSDSFTFTASDGKASAVGTVTISVTPVEDLPVASGQSLLTNEDTALPITLTATDADGDTLTYAIASQPIHGTLSGTAPNLIYHPHANVSGADSFTFTASDGTNFTEQATVSIVIAPVNDIPLVVAPIPDQLLEGEGTSIEVSLAGVFADLESPTSALAISATAADPTFVSPMVDGGFLQLQIAENRGGVTSVTVRATDPSGGWVEDTFSVSVVRPGVRVSVADANRGEENSVGPVFTISLSAPSAWPVTVTYATADITAEAGVDYVETTGSVTFAPGVVTRTVSVKPISDLLDEPDETFAFVLTSASGATLDDAEAVGTILDNDTATLTVQDISVTEGDDGFTAATFSVVLSTPSAQPVTVNFATASLSAAATVDVDFEPVSGTITFPAGTSGSQTVTVNVINDLLDENNEAFSFVLSDPRNAVLGRGTARATIVDNDAAPSVSVSDAELVEGNSGTKAMIFTVTLSEPSGLRTRIRYATSDGEAIAGVDYTAASGELVFDPGVTSRTVAVQVRGDTTPEELERFFLNLHTPTLLTIGDGQGAGTIVDDDGI